MDGVYLFCGSVFLSANFFSMLTIGFLNRFFNVFPYRNADFSRRELFRKGRGRPVKEGRGAASEEVFISGEIRENEKNCEK